jgi:hypothetical protein
MGCAVIMISVESIGTQSSGPTSIKQNGCNPEQVPEKMKIGYVSDERFVALCDVVLEFKINPVVDRLRLVHAHLERFTLTSRQAHIW